jgi:hypothetical protein
VRKWGESVKQERREVGRWGVAGGTVGEGKTKQEEGEQQVLRGKKGRSGQEGVTCSGKVLQKGGKRGAKAANNVITLSI